MRVSQQIGWSQESKLIYNILKQLDRLEVVWDGCCASTTTTTTTTASCQSSYYIVPQDPLTAFDIPAVNYTPTPEGEYTIEWFMKMTDDINSPRLFSIGAYPSAEHAVSIESDTFYYWVNGYMASSFPLTSYLGQWVWVVISRTFDAIEIYINGIRMYSDYINTAIPASGNNLVIGSEMVTPGTPVSGTNYNGLLSNFRWTVGLTVYGGGADISSQFPTAPLTVLPETVVLAFQGTTLSQEREIFKGPTISTIGREFNECFEYSVDNPFEGYEGSLRFRSI